jgi:hypothetical protein
MEPNTKNDEVSFELPKASVELLGEDGFKIQLEKLRTDSLYDQGKIVPVVRGQGCISSPTGPTC